nr:unnamed protein product [Digitaria exilis]
MLLNLHLGCSQHLRQRCTEKDTGRTGNCHSKRTPGQKADGPGIDNILYIHKDKEAGDDPDMQDVLKACCS